jgi:hypothetical protein
MLSSSATRGCFVAWFDAFRQKMTPRYKEAALSLGLLVGLSPLVK